MSIEAISNVLKDQGDIRQEFINLLSMNLSRSSRKKIKEKLTFLDQLVVPHWVIAAQLLPSKSKDSNISEDNTFVKKGENYEIPTREDNLTRNLRNDQPWEFWKGNRKEEILTELTRPFSGKVPDPRISDAFFLSNWVDSMQTLLDLTITLIETGDKTKYNGDVANALLLGSRFWHKENQRVTEALKTFRTHFDRLPRDCQHIIKSWNDIRLIGNDNLARVSTSMLQKRQALNQMYDDNGEQFISRSTMLMERCLTLHSNAAQTSWLPTFLRGSPYRNMMSSLPTGLYGVASKEYRSSMQTNGAGNEKTRLWAKLILHAKDLEAMNTIPNARTWTTNTTGRIVRNTLYFPANTTRWMVRKTRNSARHTTRVVHKMLKAARNTARGIARQALYSATSTTRLMVRKTRNSARHTTKVVHKKLNSARSTTRGIARKTFNSARDHTWRAVRNTITSTKTAMFSANHTARSYIYNPVVGSTKSSLNWTRESAKSFTRSALNRSRQAANWANNTARGTYTGTISEIKHLWKGSKNANKAMTASTELQVVGSKQMTHLESNDEMHQSADSDDETRRSGHEESEGDETEYETANSENEDEPVRSIDTSNAQSIDTDLTPDGQDSMVHVSTSEVGSQDSTGEEEANDAYSNNPKRLIDALDLAGSGKPPLRQPSSRSLESLLP
ncbi:hypothetical protein BCR39DRAFT_555897 [Naematelia encephala]|uniref:Uncharacterized protein n=1 Tax=Naematelia encephala TaxID=71784 RepID=A0A1Y2BLV6_9TREE|nr:hypothetical protein BCR39DRAFT_555897 [Naematelia encephala]